MRNRVRLYRITTVYVDPYRRDRWSLVPASDEVHPDTGLRYEDVEDGGPVEFVLPEGVEVAEGWDGLPHLYEGDSCIDSAGIVDGKGGEPALYTSNGKVTLARA